MQVQKEIRKQLVNGQWWNVELEWYENLEERQANIEVKMLDEFPEDYSHNQIENILKLIASEQANKLNKYYNPGGISAGETKPKGARIRMQFYIGPPY